MKKFFVLFLLSFNAFAADITVGKLEIKEIKKGEEQLQINHVGFFKGTPKIEINENLLTVSLNNAELKKKVSEKIKDYTVNAQTISGDVVVVNVKMPFSLEKYKNNLTVSLKDEQVAITFPRIEVATSRAPSVLSKPEEARVVAKNDEAAKFDEKYLEKIEKAAEEKVVTAEASKAENNEKTDKIKVVQSAVQKEEVVKEENTESGSNVSMLGYAGKFAGFLILMIGALYGILALFKKGVIGKGKLSFLSSTKLIEVISTNHISPKRSLMMVKAHKQVFLVANTEAGMTLISEINDVTGLIKTGEAEFTGTNFDMNLNSANLGNKEFKLKEVPEKSVGEDFVFDSLDDVLNDSIPAKTSNKTNAEMALEKAPIKDQVKISDMVKSKVKNLKQL